MSDAVLTGVVSGVLVDVITVAGRRITTEMRSIKRSRSQDLDIATWFDTYKISDSLPALPPLPSNVDSKLLEQVFQRDELHAILHELLAVRLCNAPEIEANRLRQGFQGLLAAQIPGVAPIASDLFEHLDKVICDLSIRISTERPEVLRTIRDEAQITRINATLAAIERHTSSFAQRGFPNTDEQFIFRYRRQLADYHGRIEPPDFQRRRRVAVDELYVSPTIVHRHDQNLDFSTNLDGLDDEIDRTVLLGEPGGGKTTASHVLMYRHATGHSRSVPFYIIMREFASTDPPSRSVVRHIEHKLETFYQCPAPSGLVERLLLNGAALVIFDGLDELVDTARRSDVTTIVERFCMEYPLSKVLVTSRLIGYDQASLDETQFIKHQIAGFDESNISEYVRKWFAQDPDFTSEQAQNCAQAFMEESSSVDDLRSNPLMLALMCILYRGEGWIPRNRPEVYEQCSSLLFRRWDARRRIHVDLKARNFVEPTLRYLAYWLFTRESSESAVTERDLVAITTQYFQDRGLGESDEARAAAQEFVDFCCDRAWVFSDAGTTAGGEKLYTFTHRTFLEYFASVQLASQHDTPEQLAHELVPRIARQEWEVVAQLALQVKDRAIDRGADRFYGALLGERRRRSYDSQENILAFLCTCLSFVSISNSLARLLARRAVDMIYLPTNSDAKHYLPLALLVQNCEDQARSIGSEVESVLCEHIAEQDPDIRITSLRVALYLHELPVVAPSLRRAKSPYWRDLAMANRDRFATEARDAALTDAGMAAYLVNQGEMNIDHFLSLHGPGLEILFTHIPIFASYRTGSYVNNLIAYQILNGPVNAEISDKFRVTWVRRQLKIVGDLVTRQAVIRPLDSRNCHKFSSHSFFRPSKIAMGRLSQRQRLGAGILLCIFAELTNGEYTLDISAESYLCDFMPYVEARIGSISSLAPLNLPKIYQDIFNSWARREFNFVDKPKGPRGKRTSGSSR